MKDSKKSSRVPPPHVAGRRQAKSSLPKDGAARVGFKPKPSHSSAVRSMNHLAWYVALNTKHIDKKICHIPQIKWKCPPKFTLNTGWQVAAGEGSQEAEAPSPFTSSIVEGDCPDDSETPIFPIIPIEEMAAQMPVDTSVTANTSINAQTPASCPSVSADLPVSQCNPSESQDQPAHGKSLPPMVQGLESGDLEIAADAVAAVMQSKDQIDPELLIKFLSDPQMIKKLMKENGFTSKPEDKAPTEPKAITCSSLPSLTPASVVDKLDNGGEEPASKAILSNSKPEQVNQPPILPESNKVASKVGGIRAASGPNHAPKAAKGPSHSPRFISDGQTRKLPAFSRTNQIARQQKVRPLMPSSLRPDEGTILRLVKKYGGPEPNPLNSPPSMPNLEAHKKLIHDYGDVARVKPMAPVVACASMPPPHLEEMHRKMENYLLPDHGWGKRFMGPSSSLLSSPPSPPVTNLLESRVEGTGSFHPSFASMTVPAREVDLGYHRSLIKQHGEITPSIYQFGKYLQGVEWPHKRTTIEMDPKFQKPCTYFTTSMGCQNGYDCLFQHNVPEQRRATGAVEAPINRVDVAPVAKRMKLNDHFGKWR